jgi:hypothetical protein
MTRGKAPSDGTLKIMGPALLIILLATVALVLWLQYRGLFKRSMLSASSPTIEK